MNFERKLSIGRIGETATQKFFEDRDIELLDVRFWDDWQEIDTDFLIQKDSRKIEAKMDLNESRNILVELWENIFTGREGWLYRSKCNILAYYKSKLRILILLDFAKMKQYILHLIRTKSAVVITPKRYPKTRNILLSWDSLIANQIVLGMYQRNKRDKRWITAAYWTDALQTLQSLSA